MKRRIILHAFLWKLQHVIEHLEEIKHAGYNAVQITPIQPHKPGKEFWRYYQPLSFSIGNDLGTSEDLKELCQKAKEMDIEIISDIVLRHVAGTDDGKLIPHEDVDEKLLDNPYFWTHAENTQNYKDRWCIINKAFGLPMLDYNNWDLQDIMIEFLDSLRELGISGFRVDMGKHFALKEEGSVFWERVFGRYSSLFNYAECLECDTALLDKYTKFINVLSDYHSPTDRSKLVSYIMSHDSEETWGFTKNMTDSMIIKEWKYLLESNKESHVLFYPRAWSDLWKSEAISEINHNFK